MRAKRFPRQSGSYRELHRRDHEDSRSNESPLLYVSGGISGFDDDLPQIDRTLGMKHFAGDRPGSLPTRDLLGLDVTGPSC